MTPEDYYHMYDYGHLTYEQLAEKVGLWMAKRHTLKRRETDNQGGANHDARELFVRD